MEERNVRMKPYPLGAHWDGNGIHFSFTSMRENCGILIFDAHTGKMIDKIAFEAEQKIGRVYCRYLTKYKPTEITYQFYEGDTVVPDMNAVKLAGCFEYGRERKSEELKAGFITETFDWQGDVTPKIPYHSSICYLLHVRGFTKHASSKVKYRGTFKGVIEKLSYLQEIGVTTVVLQPAYEFLEKEVYKSGNIQNLNYWGYKRGYYYTPKASYAVRDSILEFKEMVREFHKRGMEMVMQFYFPKGMPYGEIPEILRFWVLEYHVDGFHLLGEHLPIELIEQDPMLADTKIWHGTFSGITNQSVPAYCNRAVLGDDFFVTMRKFLKGDEDMIAAVQYHMCHIPDKTGRIHYMSNYCGMTLMDMVSFDRKHNEENGEDNRDGSDYNFSWNCGEEGNTRKKKVNALRIRQIKNAMCMILLSQSTPMIFMGDEFGNSQKGNNNPYCQDNLITWLDWKDLEKNRELHIFWKQLVNFRRTHPVLHMAEEPRIMDYLSCGYPDLSYHGLEPWRPRTDSYSRWFGMLYCGKYAEGNCEKDEYFIYIAINMHWEEHSFQLPGLPGKLRWKYLFSSDEKVVEGEENTFLINPRSISVFVSSEEQSKGRNLVKNE